LEIRGEVTLSKPFILDGLYPDAMPEGASARLATDFPDDHIEPLL
jgi:hypothetical protein